jgi:hypothetical protein
MIYFTLQEMMAVRAERDELERKGQELCSAYGNSLVTIHDLEVENAKLRVSNGKWERENKLLRNKLPRNHYPHRY